MFFFLKKFLAENPPKFAKKNKKYVTMLVRSLYPPKSQNKPKYVKKKKFYAENPPKLGEKIEKYVIMPIRSPQLRYGYVR